tara:strand:- start:705 stop:857 length:153 start_codon:yes stop_codon:yes gene_type:complete
MYRREQKPKKARKKLKYPYKVKNKPPIQDPYQPLPYHPLVEEIKKAYLKK